MGERGRVLPVTGWMVLRLGALGLGWGALFAGVGLGWPRWPLLGWWLLVAAVAWFTGRVGQWADDAARGRGVGDG